MSTPAVDPHVRPSGRAPKFLMTRGVGFGSDVLAGSMTSLWLNPVTHERTTMAAQMTSVRMAEEYRLSEPRAVDGTPPSLRRCARGARRQRRRDGSTSSLRGL